MAGQSKITGTLAAYAGASLVIKFIAQGGGFPIIRSASCVLDAKGSFTIEGWDNTNAAYAPSLTEFLFTLGNGDDAFYWSTKISVAGATYNASTALAAVAPTPPGVPFPLTSGAPTTTPQLGTPAFDPATNTLYIYGSAGWKSTVLS